MLSFFSLSLMLRHNCVHNKRYFNEYKWHCQLVLLFLLLHIILLYKTWYILFFALVLVYFTLFSYFIILDDFELCTYVSKKWQKFNLLYSKDFVIIHLYVITNIALRRKKKFNFDSVGRSDRSLIWHKLIVMELMV